MYATRFREHAPVLDLGCGRGEMLEVFRDAGIAARGIDLNDDSIALCAGQRSGRREGRSVRLLDALPDASLGGVVCCQVVEHLPPARLPEMIRLIHAKLRRGGSSGDRDSESGMSRDFRHAFLHRSHASASHSTGCWRAFIWRKRASGGSRSSGCHRPSKACRRWRNCRKRFARNSLEVSITRLSQSNWARSDTVPKGTRGFSRVVFGWMRAKSARAPVNTKRR